MAADPDKYRMPEPTGPVPDVFDADGALDAAKVTAILDHAKNWPAEQKHAMLSALRAAEARARVCAQYGHPAEIALAVDPSYIITPAIEKVSQDIEVVLRSPRQINLQISEPPQEGKSTLAAVYTPIRALQINPHRRIILTTYAERLAATHSMEMRRLINEYGTGVTDPISGAPMPDRIGLKLAYGANKITQWSVEAGRGGLVAVGIGGQITGLPADLVIIDDPYKSMAEADSKLIRDKVNLWFANVVRTRLAPDASIILIQCMTGDTPVLRPDGTETPLVDIRPGDEIATYDAGVLSTSKVMNWASQGYDFIYAITMESGRVVRANARHPFLLVDEGVESWVKLEHLLPGDRLMATADTPGSPASSVTNLTISIDTVSAIEPCGVAEVFDIQVERTENFIANGLVSHNTRWHTEDLTGVVFEAEKSMPREERTWKFINIPAIAEAGIKDSLNREPGTPMISARDTPDAKRDFNKIRRDVGERTFYAMYQGSPRNPSGGIFKTAWFDPRLPTPPQYPVAAVVGVDPADSGEGDDAGVIGGMLTTRGTLALTHDRSGKYTSDQWAHQAVLLALEIGARVIGVEGYTTVKTYVQVVRRAYDALHREAETKRMAGAMMTPLEKRALPDLPPFEIRPWRGANKADAVARAGGLSQSLEVKRCVVVEFALATFEDQATTWQAGQHQPDRVAAAIIVHDILMELRNRSMNVVAPPTTPAEQARAAQRIPDYMRRTIPGR